MNLNSGTFYFKADRMDDLVLLSASNLKVTPPHPALLGDQTIRLTIPMDTKTQKSMIKKSVRPMTAQMRGVKS